MNDEYEVLESGPGYAKVRAMVGKTKNSSEIEALKELRRRAGATE